VPSTNKVTHLVENFVKFTKEINDIAKNLENILNIFSSNARSVEEISAAVDNLNAMINKLDTLLQCYKT
jgi:methyl-accepting chemotaxis protein